MDYVSTVNPSAVDDPNPPALLGPKLVGPPIVSFIGLADPNPTNAATVDFQVEFSQPVTGIAIAAPFDDFSLGTTGISGATITGVSGSGSTYTVTVYTGSGNGSIHLDVIDDDSILDFEGTPLGGTNPGNGNFTGSQAYKIVKSAPKPGAPALLTPRNGILVNTLQPILDWKDSNPTISRYQLQVATNKTFTTLLVDDANRSTSSYAFVSDLLPGKMYYWRVKAFNVPGTASAWSKVWTFKTPLAQPTLLSPVDTDSLLIDRPLFDWNPVDGATQYNLQVSASANFGTFLVNGTVNGTEYLMTRDLPQNKKLYWRVRGKSPFVTGSWSEKLSFTTGNPPTVPVLAAPANNALVKDYTPALNWKDATIPTGTTFKHYEIQLDDNKEFTSPDAYTTTAGDRLDSDFTIGSDLPANARFYWRVRAVNIVVNPVTLLNEDQTSGWSKVFSFRTVIPAPTGLTATPDTLQPTFEWDTATGPGVVKNYTIQVSTNAKFTSFVLNSTTQNAFYEMTKNLPSGKLLFWRVRANGANGPSAWTTVQYTVP